MKLYLMFWCARKSLEKMGGKQTTTLKTPEKHHLKKLLEKARRGNVMLKYKKKTKKKTKRDNTNRIRFQKWGVLWVNPIVRETIERGGEERNSFGGKHTDAAPRAKVKSHRVTVTPAEEKIRKAG